MPQKSRKPAPESAAPSDNQSSSKQPDFFVYQSESMGGDKTRLIQLGAAWKHQNGTGFSIKLDALPVRQFDGQLVAFAPKQRG
ncbi:hypothetical protein [Cerasicoccus fimbriatus]|uniref:hypothetical protein n=1 Tax=Cerasicoccus fimbriatus TaxID=3014554 RepID=UPI0022B2B622|nr:hypothetical protein [Cerasicoccus sp. TK19100]